MKPQFQHPFRIAGRILWMIAVFLLMTARYVVQCAFVSKDRLQFARARWLQQFCRRLLPVLGLQARSFGPIPTRGLLVCNHLSYVDILVFCSMAPAVFVAKQDLKSWPVFGWFATMAGTLYIDRQRRTHVGELNGQMQNLLKQDMLVILFPEGTSSGGDSVLPFKSSLLEPAVQSAAPLSVARIGYELPDGSVSEEICYWRDMTFFPHLVNLLGKRRILAWVRFKEVPRRSADRKDLALELRGEILRLRKD